jgi:hypothetical protein
MHVNGRTRLAVTSGALALALTAAACNKSDDSVMSGARGTSGTTADGSAAVTLTGCLQRGSGIGNFILTQANMTSESVGTSGSAAGGDVAREQRDAAAKSYRLDGEDGKLRDLVGKQVRVSGRLTDRGDVNKTDRDRDERGTVGKPDRDIDSSDLARVNVDSVDKVADSCGTPK